MFALGQHVRILSTWSSQSRDVYRAGGVACEGIARDSLAPSSVPKMPPSKYIKYTKYNKVHKIYKV